MIIMCTVYSLLLDLIITGSDIEVRNGVLSCLIQCVLRFVHFSVY